MEKDTEIVVLAYILGWFITAITYFVSYRLFIGYSIAYIIITIFIIVCLVINKIDTKFFGDDKENG
jgi:hypothetical protein